jgi:hypothetical protein
MVTFGRYFDQWSRRDDRWAIDHRRFVYDVVLLSPPDADGRLGALAAQRRPQDTAGRRDRTDPSYQVLGATPA